MTEECCLIYPCLEPGEPDNTQFIVGSSDTQGSSIGFYPGPQENRELFLEMVVVCIRRHSFPHKPSGSALEVPTGACQNLHRASQSVIDIWTAIGSSVIKPKWKSLERHYFGSLAKLLSKYSKQHTAMWYYLPQQCKDEHKALHLFHSGE